MKTLEQIQEDTSGTDIQKYNKPRVSPFKCDCGGQIYYDTSQIIVYGKFTRTGTCEQCNKNFKITNENK
jgi:hypothetical protein